MIEVIIVGWGGGGSRSTDMAFSLTRLWRPCSRHRDPRRALSRSNQPDCLALIVSRFVWEVRAPEC